MQSREPAAVSPQLPGAGLLLRHDPGLDEPGVPSAAAAAASIAASRAATAAEPVSATASARTAPTSALGPTERAASAAPAQ